MSVRRCDSEAEARSDKNSFIIGYHSQRANIPTGPKPANALIEQLDAAGVLRIHCEGCLRSNEQQPCLASFMRHYYVSVGKLKARDSLPRPQSCCRYCIPAAAAAAAAVGSIASRVQEKLWLHRSLKAAADPLHDPQRVRQAHLHRDHVDGGRMKSPINSRKLAQAP